MISENKKTISYLGWCLFTFVVLSNIASFLAVWLVKTLAPEFTKSTWYIITMASLPMYLIAFPVFLFMINRVEKEKLEKRRSYEKTDVVKLICICIATTYCLNIVSLAINYLIGMLKHSTIANPLESLISGSSVWALIAYAVIIAPILEELIFRKLLLERLKPFGPKIAIVLSALAFAMIHGNLSQLLYAFVLGLFFGYIAYETGSIKLTILIHVSVNFIGTGAGALLGQLNNDNYLFLFGVIVMTIFIGGIIFFIKDGEKLFGFKKIMKKKDNTICTCEGTFETIRVREAIATPGMIFFLLSGIALIITNIMM